MSGVFEVIDYKKASQRRGLHQQAATKSAVRSREPRFFEIIDGAIGKSKRDAAERGTADVYKWWSMMAIDV